MKQGFLANLGCALALCAVSARAAGNGFKLWLEAQQARYESWLARL